MEKREADKLYGKDIEATARGDNRKVGFAVEGLCPNGR